MQSAEQAKEHIAVSYCYRNFGFDDEGCVKYIRARDKEIVEACRREVARKGAIINQRPYISLEWADEALDSVLRDLG